MVNLSPSYGKYHVREPITLTATVLNGTNAPVAGISVSFSIWGIEPRATLRAAVSDANGIAITFRSLDAGKITVVPGARNDVKTPVVSQPAHLRIVDYNGYGETKQVDRYAYYVEHKVDSPARRDAQLHGCRTRGPPTAGWTQCQAHVSLVG